MLLVPVLFLALFAVWSYRVHYREAEGRMFRTLDLLFRDRVEAVAVGNAVRPGGNDASAGPGTVLGLAPQAARAYSHGIRTNWLYVGSQTRQSNLG